MTKLNNKKIFCFGCLLISFISFIYILTIKGNFGNFLPIESGKQAILANKPPFETSMERGRFTQVVSIVESHSLNVNKYYKFLMPDLAWYNGNFYSTLPLGTAFLSIPFYIIGKSIGLSQVFTSLTTTLFSIITAYLIYLSSIKLKINPILGVLSSIIFSLASIAWPYSVSYSAHPISAFIITLGFYSILNLEEGSKQAKYYFIIGVLFGLCFLVDYTNIAIFSPFIFYLFFKKILSIVKKPDGYDIEMRFPKKLFYAIGAFFIIFTVYLFLNFNMYGKPIAFTNAYTIKSVLKSGVSLDQALNKSRLNNNIFKDAKYSKRFSLNETINGVNTLLFSHDRGLLFFSPVYIFAIIGFIIHHKKERRLAILIGVVFLLNLLIYASYDDPWGGWAFGPRYLIVSLPLLAILCGYAFEYLINRFGIIAKIGIFLTLTYSSSIALLGALTTNAVPPSIEVVGTRIHDNFLYNWKYLINSGTSSFIYSVLFSKIFTPFRYGLIVLAVVLLFEFIFLFILYRKNQIIKTTLKE